MSDYNNDDTITKRRREPSPLFTVCPLILGNEFCERLAFYGIASNMVRYLQVQIGMGEAQSSSQVMLWQGTCYFTPILGAYMADAVWGRYKTILIFSLVYAIGMMLLAGSASLPGLKPDPVGHADWYTYLVYLTALYVVAFGTGGIKPNVSSFGADQFDDANPSKKKAKQSFFNWFYFTVNLGSLIALTWVTWVQENLGWGIGYLFPGVVMLVAFALFMIGSPFYKHIKVAESPIARVIKVVCISLTHRKPPQINPEETPLIINDYLHENNQIDDNDQGQSSNSFSKRKQINLPWLNKAIGHEYQSQGETKNFTAEQVHEVRLVLGVLPIFFATIMHATCYIQISSCFVQQGYAMDMQVPGTKFQVPAASLQAFDALSILILVPLWDRIIVPVLSRYNMKPTMLQRIGIGMCIAFAAMLLAGIVESVRLNFAHRGLFVDTGNSNSLLDDAFLTRPVKISVFWQIPQFFLVGASEVLGFIGYLEFFYDQAPTSMRSVCMCLSCLNIAFGSYLGVVILKLVQLTTDWLPNDYNKGHLNYYFFLLAFIMLLNICLFVFVASKYQYKVVDHSQQLPEPILPPVVQEDHVTHSIIIEDSNQNGELHEFKYSRSLAIHPSAPNESKLHG
eukprot:TRINITY_DN13967_c1_g1_i2.p1 TRINITY_DN13967_c1_g1~~TRINITY_DN13967_c1_g1_i2.p1  ORF type:complete len:623 (-),score=82.66 TRINITY_DN13967_c1_g1_i2:1000-2868(-)